MSEDQPFAENAQQPNDFSTNRCSGTSEMTRLQLDRPSPTPHPELCFTDGNLAIMAGDIYFLVHQGLVCRHSVPLASLIRTAEAVVGRFLLEGRPILEIPDAAEDVYHFLLALYDGVSHLKHDVSDFYVVSAILRLSAKYEIKHLKADVLRGLASPWPKTLAQWELRESKATNITGIYEPRKYLPHPLLVINLARSSNTPELLPAAFYDLSRCAPSDCVSGYTCPVTGVTHTLSDNDLLSLLRGKEHASHFLSTFIVNELEGREPSMTCVHRNEVEPHKRRICQAAFEAVTFELLRDVNGMVSNRTSDPLFAIMDAELMQMRNDPLGRPNSMLRACEFCRSEFGAAVDAAREELWQRLPLWFGVDPQVWI